MALDPLVKTFLEQQPSGPKAWELSDAKARDAFRAFVKSYGPKDVPIGKVETATIPGGIALRLYRPVAAGGDALPALIYFHGGAFRLGDLETHEAVCRVLAGEAACRVIAVDYRLAGEHPFPAAYDDAFAALSFVETNAPALGVDPNRIAVGGDAAGGTLAAALCQRVNGKGLAHQLLLFPATRLGGDFPSLKAFGEGHGLDRDAFEYSYELYAPRTQWNDPRLSPLLATDLSGLPSATVVLAEYDPLHDEGLAYAERLRAAGVSVAVLDYPGQIHGFILFQAVFPQAREALVRAGAALKEAFAGP